MELYEERLAQSTNIREEKLQTHVQTIQQLEREIEVRGARIREVTREREEAEARMADEIAAVREELEVKKEQVSALQNTAAVIDVYKKKIADMALLQQDLQSSHQRISYLQDEVDLLKQDRVANKNLKECLALLQTELDSAKSQRVAAVTQAGRLEQRLKEVQQERSESE